MAASGTGVAMEIEGEGMLVAPGNVQGLAAAVIALAGDEASRARMGAAARTHAKQRWDRSTIVRSLELEFLTLTRRSAVDLHGLSQPRVPPAPSTTV